ncbi:MAG: hypothetical protein HY959_00445 [Ignavibacteriae bacterium]|nr:hypothetical protein [Ignavibacteriota bacterium]
MKGRIALAAVLFAVFAFINGCDSSYNNPIETQKSINVSGRVIGYLFNQGLPYAKIRIEDKIITADQFGKFYIPEVKTPYTVYITDSASSRGCIYEGLSEPECHLKFVNGTSPNELRATVNVSYSGNIGTSNARKIFFTDGKNVSGIGNDPFCEVFLPDNTPVTGKVCYLLYTTGISFDKFGYIDNVTLAPNVNVNLSFNDSICSFHPYSVSVSGSINTFSNNIQNNYAFSTIFVSPRQTNFYSTNIQFENFSGNTFNILLPANLSVNYYPLMYIIFQNTSNNHYTQAFYSLPKAGGTGIVLNAPSTPIILSPAENSVLDSNTNISFSGTGTQEFFYLTISDSLKSIKYITSANSVNLSSISKLGLGRFNPNSRIYFEVLAISQFNSLNDFVNPNINNLAIRNSFPVSRQYYFNP